MKRTGIAFLLVLLAYGSGARQTDPLLACWKAQVQPLAGRYLAVSYKEQLNELYHSAEPWQQLHYTGSGSIWYSQDAFGKEDTITAGKRVLYSKTWLTGGELLQTDYGHTAPSAVTQNMFLDKLIETARYTPAPLICYFIRQKTPRDTKSSNAAFSVYTATIHATVTSLYVRNSDHRLAKVTTLENDDLLGDMLNTFTYSDYAAAGPVEYPKTIRIDKVNGRVKDEIRIVSALIVPAAPALPARPAGYKTDTGTAAPTLQHTGTENYSDHIHFIDLLPTGSKVMVVEFRDFLAVAEAPLNSENGERIISEAHKIAPGKPIRYFTFGHHHPDYIGGMRAFIHKGATVLSVPQDSSYVGYLARAPHMLHPDSLQLQPRLLKWAAVTDSLTITDGSYAMHIYHIGGRSGHTADYLVYYFPQEKLLFEGDLVWVKKEGPAGKAGGTQAGLYQAIEDLRLDVRTIVQSWGIAFGSYKTVIPFEDLVQSAGVK